MQIDPRLVVWDSDATPDALRNLVTQEAQRQGVPVDLALSVMQVESNGRQSARSPKGAIGPMQLMPGTAKELGVDPFDPVQNIRGGVSYLKRQLDQFQTPELALAAYNAGPGAVAKANGVPPFPETQQYVAKVQEGAQKRPTIDPRLVAWDSSPQPSPPQEKKEDGTWFAGGAKGVASGVLRGAADMFMGGWQLGARGLEAAMPAGSKAEELARKGRQALESWDQRAEQDYLQNYRDGKPVGFDAARLVGGIGASLPLAMAAPATLTGATAASTLFSALQPVRGEGDFWTEKAKQTGIGLATGPLAYGAGKAVSRVISPQSSPEVQLLRREGVQLTPGQTAGGMWKTAEEKAASLPILGAQIREAGIAGNESLNRAAINRALFNIGDKLPKNMSGNEAVTYADDALGRAYDKVLDKIGAAPVDDALLNDLGRLQTMVANQPKEMGERLGRIIDNEVLARTQYGRLPGEAVKKAEANLGKLGRDLLRDTDSDKRVLGEAVLEAQRSMRNWLERVAPEGVAAELKRVNTGWANFKRAERAAASVAAPEGVFSAAQLHNAVKALDRSKDKGAFARGDALMQDLSSAAKSTMGQQVNNSGTTDRAALAYLGASLMNPTKYPAVLGQLTGLTGLSIPYLPGARQAINAAIAGRQGTAWKALANETQTLSPALGALLAPAGYGLLE